MSSRDRVSGLLAELRNFGPVIPGKVSEQYNVCGKSGCRCKDKKNPQRHGPYYQLSYTLCGKSSTRTVLPENLDSVKRLTSQWGALKVLERELASECLVLLKEEGPLAVEAIVVDSPDSKRLKEQDTVIVDLKKRLQQVEKQRDTWKSRTKSHSSTIHSLRAQVRDLSKSRDDWKVKAKTKSEVETLVQKKNTR